MRDLCVGEFWSAATDPAAGPVGAYERNWLSYNLPDSFDADAPTIDPMKLSRLVNPTRKKHTLAAICERVDIPYVGSHPSDSGCRHGCAGVLPAAR